MWKKNQDMPDEGGIRIPGSKRFRDASDDPGQIHVESVKSKAGIRSYLLRSLLCCFSA